MKYYVRYEIKLEEPVKMGKQGSQSNTQSLSYLTGSSLRGAILGKFISVWCKGFQGDLSREPEYRDTLFKNTYFFDAYPKFEKTSMIPVPELFYADKHELRRAMREEEKSGKNVFAIHGYGALHEKPAEGENSVDVGRYCLFSEKKMRTKAVKKTANLHIALDDGINGAQMFEYEAIAAGQVFEGILCCGTLEDAKKYRDILQNEVFYLGGSKGSGYGRCRIGNARLAEWEEIRQEFPAGRTGQEGTLVVYALSNLILTDEWGSPTGKIREGFWEEKLGISGVKLEKSFVSTILTSGFNHTWRAGQVQQTAVRAGSVFIYSYTGSLDLQNAAQLEEEGVGLRRTEGFGRILFNLTLEQEICEHIKEGAQAQDERALKPEEGAVLAELSGRIREKRRERSLEKDAYKIAADSGQFIPKFSLTQISRLYAFLHDIQVMKKDELSREEAKRKIEKFLEEDLKGKTKQSYEEAVLKLHDRKRLCMRDVLKELTDDRISVSDWRGIPEEKETPLFGEVLAGFRDPFMEKGELLRDILYNMMRREGGRK